MNIDKIFSTRERLKILTAVIYSEGEFGVNETAKRLKLSKGLVSKYFGILEKEGIIGRKRNKFSVMDSGVVKGIKTMLNTLRIDPDIFRRYRFVRSAGLYGSCAKGTNTVKSDVDLWVKIDKADDEELAGMTSELRREIENVKILILDDRKIKMLQSEDPVFYYSLFFGSIHLYGVEDEI